MQAMYHKTAERPVAVTNVAIFLKFRMPNGIHLMN
jgi:hypothetical protein